jgi:PhnB protein
MAKLAPYIYSEDARSQAEFYIQALGGELQGVMTYGQAPDAANEANKHKVMHLTLIAAGITLYMADSVFEPVQRGNGLDLNIEYTS